MLRQSNKTDYFLYKLWVVDPGILSLIVHINTEAVLTDAKAATGRVRNLSVTRLPHLYNVTEPNSEKHRKDPALLLGAGCNGRQPALKGGNSGSFQCLEKRQSLTWIRKTGSPRLLSRGTESFENVSRWHQPRHHFMGTWSHVNQKNPTWWIFFQYPQIIVVLCHRPKGKLNFSHNWIWYLQACLKKRERKFILEIFLKSWIKKIVISISGTYLNSTHHMQRDGCWK